MSPSAWPDLRSFSAEFVTTNSGWINTVPLNSGSTLNPSKRSVRSKRIVDRDSRDVKDYLKKRALILTLLVRENKSNGDHSIFTVYVFYRLLKYRAFKCG